MKKWLIVAASLLSAVLYQNCGGRHETRGSVASSSEANLAVSLAAFEKTLFPILTAPTNCITCHGVTQQPLHSLPEAELSHDIILSFDLVDLLDPAGSAIVEKIRGGHQNFPATLADQLEDAVQAWADDIIAHGGTIGEPNGILLPTFVSIHANILQPKCVSCHKADGVRPNENYSNYESTLNTGKISVGNAAASQMYIECSTGSMPQNGTPLTPQELQTIFKWINDGAPYE